MLSKFINKLKALVSKKDKDNIPSSIRQKIIFHCMFLDKNEVLCYTDSTNTKHFFKKDPIDYSSIGSYDILSLNKMLN